jgi:hypothetical protein
MTSAPQQIASSSKGTIRSLPIELWPEADRKAWTSACQAGHRLQRGGPGSHLKPITQRDLARRYGYFLDFMHRRGLLDADKPAAGHVTPENVDSYLAELNGREAGPEWAHGGDAGHARDQAEKLCHVRART